MARRRGDLPEVSVAPELRNRLAQGHPWVYADQVRGGGALASGSWVRVRCGSWSGVGLWDAQSAIAVRMFARNAPPDAQWLRERVEDAWLLRGPLRQQNTTAYRWLYGESDGVPGIVVDLYGQYAIVQTYAQSVATLVPWLVAPLRASASLQGIV